MKAALQSKLVVFFLIFSVTFLMILLYIRTTNPSYKCVHSNDWIETLSKKQWNVYSQSSEDGVIDAIFKNIGTTNKVYVEFGVENCNQCNTRYLREKGWDAKNSLLMDGGYKNKDINLQQVIFWPSNILDHFKKFGVPTNFDLLSVDTDAYDWFMLETILEAGFRPRVIVSEINANFDSEDAKSIMPPSDWKSWERWDGTAYHGTSILALYYLFNRFSYSMVFCNNINCFAVRDEILETCIRKPITNIFVQNAHGRGHHCDYKNRSMAVIDPSGHWTGEEDGGAGSPMIRHTGCKPGGPAKKPYIVDVKQATDPA